MRAYVQEVRKQDPIYLGLLQTAFWFEQRGYEVVPFQFDEITQGRLDDDLLNHPEEMVLRGGVETVRQALLRVGRPMPPNLDLPESLAEWRGRRVWESTLGDIRRSVELPDFVPVHVKPLRHHKLFKGTIVRQFRDLIPTAGIDSTVPVLVQEYVEFVSEWRVSVLRDRILKVGHYRGDPVRFPDAKCMQTALSAFRERPIGFAMDWGITASGQTFLVEVNDGYSLGNYGLAGAEYTALIEARWRQLMGLPDNGVGDVS